MPKWLLQKRSVEDLKERYYSVCNRLVKARSGDESQMVAYDAPHEVKRKMQVRMCVFECVTV